MNSQKNLALARAIFKQVARNASSSSEAVAPRFQKMKQLQAKLGTEDGIPVYIKSGLGDKVLYQLTLGATLVGVGLSLETFYRLAVPQS